MWEGRLFLIWNSTGSKPNPGYLHTLTEIGSDVQRIYWALNLQIGLFLRTARECLRRIYKGHTRLSIYRGLGNWRDSQTALVVTLNLHYRVHSKTHLRINYTHKKVAWWCILCDSNIFAGLLSGRTGLHYLCVKTSSFIKGTVHTKIIYLFL